VEKHVARLRNTVNDIPGMSNVFPFNQFYFGTEQDEIISFFITSNLISQCQKRRRLGVSKGTCTQHYDRYKQLIINVLHQKPCWYVRNIFHFL